MESNTFGASSVELHDLVSRHLPEPVPYALIAPPGYLSAEPAPLCIVLMGGGGSRQSLVDCQPLFDAWWADGSLPPMVLATPSPGMSYYVDDEAAGVSWGAFLADDFLSHLRATCRIADARSATAVIGISMGGYGALKTAFAYPDRFAVVAAIQPILEPGFRDADVGARNRLHHLSGGPANLIGAGREAALVEANNPANRARANQAAIRNSGLEIYVEVGDEDFVNAHDGTEFLHRVLWDLDLRHEYRLIRGGDHGGPTLVPRMHDAFAWTGRAIAGLRRAETAVPTAEEQAVTDWLASRTGAPPHAAPSSREFLRIVRAQLQPVRDQAALTDPTMGRRYGRLT